jgi:hypothetical protein
VKTSTIQYGESDRATKLTSVVAVDASVKIVSNMKGAKKSFEKIVSAKMFRSKK